MLDNELTVLRFTTGDVTTDQDADVEASDRRHRPHARGRLIASLVAGGLYLVAGVLVLVDPIFGIGLATAPWAAVLGWLLAPDVVAASGRWSRLGLGAVLYVGAVILGSATYTLALALALAAPAGGDGSPGGFALLLVLSTVSLAIFYAPIGLPLGLAWGWFVPRWWPQSTPAASHPFTGG